MTHKLPLQPSPEESAQLRADRLTLPIEHPFEWLNANFAATPINSLAASHRVGPRIEFNGEKK